MEFDCQSCGACCVGLDVLLSDEEAGRFEAEPRLTGLTVLRSDRPGLMLRFLMRHPATDRCVALRGPLTGCCCGIYEQRPALCRTFVAGSPDCLAARGRLGDLRTRDAGRDS